MDQEVHLTWHGPLSFLAGESVPCASQDHIARTRCGVYVWTIEHEGSHLINYVGKVYSENVSRTFAVRFGEELAYERRQEIKVDVDLFLQGTRKAVLPHRDRVEEVLGAYRIFVAPLSRDLGDSAVLKIEGSLINALHDAGHKFAAFLWNPRCPRRFDGKLTMDPANLLGLDAITT